MSARSTREIELEIEVINLRKRVLELEQVAVTDTLTGLLNRRGGEKALARMTNRAARGGSLSALMFDLDHFKRVNDTFGHDAGDTVLKEVGEIIREHLRATDAGIRWGGEEILILTDVDAGGAMFLAERLRQAIYREVIVAVEKKPLHLTASFGVAEHEGGNGWAQMVAEADEAMYRAKRGGRNRVELAIVHVASPIALGE